MVTDPSLNGRRAYVVEEAGFREHLAAFDKIEDEKSTCNNHDAIKSASIRGGKDAAASGMGSAQCGRHDMKRPCGVGDLQKGERYVNMDHFFLSTICLFSIVLLIVSYDIACQWSKNLAVWCAKYAKLKPNVISEDPDLDIKFAVPKFHLPAHVPACQLNFSLNRIKGVGRTDGECPERLWSTFNGLAYSTREMGPGSRRDTLDDNFGDHNWDKTTRLAATLLAKAEEAIEMREDQIDAYVSLCDSLPQETVNEFTRRVQAWEADPLLPNPYRGSTNSITASSVRLKLANDDAEAQARGEGAFLHKEVTPSLLIYQGIEIEDQQRRSSFDQAELGPHSTDLQRAKILERSLTLKRKFDAFITIQHLYVPALAALRKEEEEEETNVEEPDVWNIPLYLPSSTTPSHVPSPPLELVQLENVYRQAQAYSTLRQLRALLLLQLHMRRSKKVHVVGNRMLTRSRQLLETVKIRIERAAEKYRLIRRCLRGLGLLMGSVMWQETFPELDDDNIRALTEDDDGGEGRKKLTWIWKVRGVSMENADEVQAELRIEWCRARARAHRWQEECLLLAEEMRRVKEFFQWEVTEWEKHGRVATKKHGDYVINPNDPQKPAVVQEKAILQNKIIDVGKMCYASRQGEIRRRMWKACNAQWGTTGNQLKKIDMGGRLSSLPKGSVFSATKLVEVMYT